MSATNLRAAGDRADVGGCKGAVSADGRGSVVLGVNGSRTLSVLIPALLGVLVALAGTGAPAERYSEGGTWYSALTDVRGSQLGYVDDQGNASSSFTAYDPFGAPLPGSSTTTGVGFSGEWQAASGLINLRARAYDPVLARFVGRDTFGGVLSAPQSANRYTFGQTNQLLAVDPSGHLVNHYLANPQFQQFIFSSIPVVSTIYFGASLWQGHDIITNEPINDANRAFYWAGFGLSLVGDLPLLNSGIRMAGSAFDRLVPRIGEAFSGLRLGERFSGALDRLGLGLGSLRSETGSVNLGGIVDTARSVLSRFRGDVGASRAPTLLSLERIKITDRAIDVVEQHLGRFVQEGQPLGALEAGMVNRLRRIATGDLAPTIQDVRFYSHELRESVLYRNAGYLSGQPSGGAYELWNVLHTQALRDYGYPRNIPGDFLYHPSVGSNL